MKAEDLSIEMLDAAKKAGWSEEKQCALRMTINVFTVLGTPESLIDSLAHLYRHHDSKAAARMVMAICDEVGELAPLLKEAAALTGSDTIAGPHDLAGLKERAAKYA